jgi:hypothetical protein
VEAFAPKVCISAHGLLVVAAELEPATDQLQSKELLVSPRFRGNGVEAWTLCQLSYSPQVVNVCAFLLDTDGERRQDLNL